MPSFIDDGYAFKAVLNPKKHIHDGIKFVYRPATPSEEAEYQAKASPVKGKDARRLQAQVLMDKVKSWNLFNDQPAPTMTIELLMEKLNPDLFSRMFYVVMQYESPDDGEPCNLGELEKN